MFSSQFWRVKVTDRIFPVVGTFVKAHDRGGGEREESHYRWDAACDEGRAGLVLL